MNRYSRVTPSQFNPLSLSEIMAPALSKQKTHDTTIQRLDELGLFDINRLEQDEDFSSKYINDYTDKVNKQAEAIMANGVDAQSMRDMMKLKQDRDNFLKNDGRDIIQNYQKFQANKAILDKKLASDQISGKRYEEILELAKKGYDGFQKGSYQDYYGAAEQDVGEYMKKSLVGLQPSQIAQHYGLKQSGVNGVLTYANSKHKSLNPLKLKDGKITQENMIEKYVTDRVMGSPEIMADFDHRKKYDPNFNAEKYISNLAKSTDYAGGNIQETYDRKYMNSPTNGSSKAEKKPFEYDNIYASDTNTRNIFAGKGNSSEIKSSINDLMTSKKPKEVNQGNILNNQYNRAQESFKKNNPTSVAAITKHEGHSTYNDLMNGNLTGGKTYTHSEITDLFNNVGVLERNANSKNTGGRDRSANFAQANPYNANSGDRIEIDGRYVNIKDNNNKVIGSMSKKEYEKMSNEKNGYLKARDNYEDEFENYLQDYTDHTRNYMLTDLKSSEDNNIDQTLTTWLRDGSTGNLKDNVMNIKMYTKDGEDLDDTEEEMKELSDENKRGVINSIKSGDGDVEFLSFTSENENGVPSVNIRVKLENGKYANADLQLNKLRADNSLAKNVETYILDSYGKYGGTSGKILKQRSLDRMKWKDVTPSSVVEFNQSDTIKSKMSSTTNRILENKIGKGYKIDIEKGDNGMFMIAVGGNDGKGNTIGEALKWNDLFESKEDINNLQEPQKIRYLENELLKYTNKFDVRSVTGSEYNQFIDHIINNDVLIMDDNYIDLLNLISK